MKNLKKIVNISIKLRDFSDRLFERSHGGVGRCTRRADGVVGGGQQWDG